MERLLQRPMMRDGIRQVFSEVTNRGLEILLQMLFEELKGRGISWGLDGPYSSWDPKWGADAVGILELLGSMRDRTIHPVPNPPHFLQAPSSAGATGPDPDQSRRV